MTQKELIDFCNSRESPMCNSCPYDRECDAYFDKFREIPIFEEKHHPERYTDEEILTEGVSDE